MLLGDEPWLPRSWSRASDPATVRLSGIENPNVPALDVETALGEQAHGLGIDPVLFGEDARAERLFGVVLENGNGGLDHDRSMIGFLVDEVNCATGNSGPRIRAPAAARGDRGRRAEARDEC